MGNPEKRANDEGMGAAGIPTALYGDARVGLGAQIGPYKLVSILGEGGCGIVYLAEQQRPVKRRVALKVIKPGMDSKQVIARFEAERQALALLNHPNIAHVFNAGTTEAGRPYFAMQYVKGVPITEHCDRYKRTIEERLRLFMTICGAVQHAHQKAIIHRDIKPSNILVAYEGEQAVPMIIDFGVAKALSQSLTERTLVTEQAQMIGTPEYMSPEQAEMTSQDIDTRTDVYSLGVLLYELLTGTLPFDPHTLREAGVEGMRRMIREQDPKTPSITLTQLQASQKSEIKNQKSKIDQELDWITLKAMDKDRTRRYQTAYALAEDIQRYLDQEPVLAGPPSTLYKVRKLVLRNKGLFASATTIAAVVVLAAIVSTVLAIKATEAKKVAEQATQSEAKQREKAETAQRTAEALAKQQEEDLYFNHISLAHQQLQANRPVHAIDLLRRCPEHLRHWEWYYLWRQCQFQKTPPLEFESTVVSLAVSPDGSKLAVLCTDGHVAVRDHVTGQETSFQVQQPYSDQLKRYARNEIFQWVAFSPEGRHLAVAVDGNSVDLISLDSGTVEQRFSGHVATIVRIVFAPDGQRVATAALDTVQIWQRDSGRHLRTLSFRDYISGLAFSGDGRRLYTGHWAQGRGSFKVWDSWTGEELESPPRHSGPVTDIEVSGDGQWLATASWDDTIAISSLVNGITKRLTGHLSAVIELSFSSDGRRLASLSNDGTVRVWEVESGRQILKLAAGDGYYQCSAFSRDGRKLFVANGTRTPIVFDGSEEVQNEIPQSTVLRGHECRVVQALYSPSGDYLASASEDGSIAIWRTLDGVCVSTLVMDGFGRLAYSSNGQWIGATSGEQGKSVVKVWEAVPPHRELFSWVGDDFTYGVAFDANDKYLIVGGSSGIIRVLDWQANRLVGNTRTLHDMIVSFSVSPDGRSFTSVGVEGGIAVWDLTRVTAEQEGRTVFRSSPSGCYSATVGYSPDGRRLAVGDREGNIVVLDVESGERVMSIPIAHGEFAVAVSFSPDGKYLASCSADQTVRIWDAEAGKSVDVLIGHEGKVNSVAWSPDGRHVASAGDDGMVRIWTPRLD